MPNWNHIEIIGHLTRDPQLSYTPSQTAICSGGIAETETWYGQDKQKHEDTLFVDYVLFGKAAETFNKYLSKGDPVMLVGKLSLDQWEAKDGSKRSKHKIKVDKFVFMPRKDGGQKQQQSPPPDEIPDEALPF